MHCYAVYTLYLWVKILFNLWFLKDSRKNGKKLFTATKCTLSIRLFSFPLYCHFNIKWIQYMCHVYNFLVAHIMCFSSNRNKFIIFYFSSSFVIFFFALGSSSSSFSFTTWIDFRIRAQSSTKKDTNTKMRLVKRTSNNITSTTEK